ncbi:MAG: hypothetical protein ACM3JI_00020 [Anaerolineae bacterium]
MIEASSIRKNKICLSDYDYAKDIENRLLMAQFSILDLEVLAELLYSSLKIPIRKLANNLDIDNSELLPILDKISRTRLLTYDEDFVFVDKDMRKYYEMQIVKFDDDFKPGMEFLQGLLRKVPIHVLPAWYSIPRTSNNIFDSLVEKYLLTPQIFQRYLSELNFGDPILSEIAQDVYESPDLKLFSSTIVEKYKLSREQFEEYMLYLEFNFVCCLWYNLRDEHWQEVVTPFYEWGEYLRFLRHTEVKSIAKTAKIMIKDAEEFTFIKHLSVILALAKKQPIPLTIDKKGCHLKKSDYESIVEKSKIDLAFIERLIEKLCLLKLSNVVEGHLHALASASDWLEMTLENRALFLYRHPLNRLISENLPFHIPMERSVHEAEKSVLRVLQSGWVLYDDFIKGVLVSLSDASTVTLKKTGKLWKYSLPTYSDEEKTLIKETIFHWLPEMGMVATGTYEGQDCFTLTPFGRDFFGT